MADSILITGASSGIGKALAFEMARRGYTLGLAARREDELETIQKQIREKHPSTKIAVRHLDVTAYETIPEVLAYFTSALGSIDIVMVNAGIGLGEKVGRGKFDQARKTIETNMIGAMATVDAAVQYFLNQGKGHIVGVSSVAAFRGMPGNASYSASKAGFAVYLEALRAEVYKKNIHVTVLYPGYIDTPLNNMISSRPFLISVEKGASIIADLIEKKVKSSTVPVFPWNIVGKLLKLLPTSVIAKMA
jgi:short-subunit dehydrogenase